MYMFLLNFVIIISVTYELVFRVYSYVNELRKFKDRQGLLARVWVWL